MFYVLLVLTARILSCLAHVFHDYTKKRHVFLNVFRATAGGKHVSMEDVHAVHVFMEDVEEDAPLLCKFMEDVNNAKKSIKYFNISLLSDVFH